MLAAGGGHKTLKQLREYLFQFITCTCVATSLKNHMTLSYYIRTKIFFHNFNFHEENL
jgi:hypothetical protein